MKNQTEIWQQMPRGHEHLGEQRLWEKTHQYSRPGEGQWQIIQFRPAGESWKNGRDVRPSHCQCMCFVPGSTCTVVDHVTTLALGEIFQPGCSTEHLKGSCPFHHLLLLPILWPGTFLKHPTTALWRKGSASSLTQNLSPNHLLYLYPHANLPPLLSGFCHSSMPRLLSVDLQHLYFLYKPIESPFGKIYFGHMVF